MAHQVIHAICGHFKVPKWLMGHIPLTRTNAFMDAPIDPRAARGGGCPVVIFAHSLGGLRIQNTAMLEELASRGCAFANRVVRIAQRPVPSNPGSVLDSSRIDQEFGQSRILIGG